MVERSLRAAYEFIVLFQLVKKLFYISRFLLYLYDLAGMPADFMESLTVSAAEPDAFEITLSYPHVVPIMRQCSVEETRKQVRLEICCTCCYLLKLLHSYCYRDAFTHLHPVDVFQAGRLCLPVVPAGM